MYCVKLFFRLHSIYVQDIFAVKTYALLYKTLNIFFLGLLSIIHCIVHGLHLILFCQYLLILRCEHNHDYDKFVPSLHAFCDLILLYD